MIDASVPPAPIASYPERSPSPEAHRQPVAEHQPVPEEPVVVIALLEQQATDARGGEVNIFICLFLLSQKFISSLAAMHFENSSGPTCPQTQRFGLLSKMMSA